MQGLLRHLIVPALALAALAFAPTVGRAQIVTSKGVDKAQGKGKVDVLEEVDTATGKVPDAVKGVPFTPTVTAVPEASSLVMMGVVVTAATVVGLSRRARKPVA
jgi:hypothetical protein